MAFHHNLYDFSNKLLQSKFFFGLEVLVSTVLGITLVFPVLGTLLLLNEILRFFVKIYLWLRYEDSVQLSDDECGSSYQIIPAERRHTILYLGEVEGTLKEEEIQENYQKNVIENPAYWKLTHIWEKRWPYICLTKCDTFDMKNHVRYYPGTENKTVTEKELLKEILPDLSLDMTDPTKPQWEEVIIPYYERPAQISTNEAVDSEESDKKGTISLRIIRMHHSYMDGASTLIMIANTFSGEASTFPYVIDPCKPLKISKVAMFLYKLTSLALFSSILLRNTFLPPILRRSRFSVSKNSPGKNLFGWTNKIPMEYFQSIKDKSGVSMPAIVSSVLASALRNLELKYPYNTGETKDDLPTVPDEHSLWVVAGMFPYVSNKPRNEHIVIETLVNTSDISGCERLSIMNDDLGRLAKNPKVTGNYWCAKILGRAPRTISEALFSLAACPALLSNVPLCTRNIKLWGKECNSIVGWVPLMSRTGLGVVSVRYGDHFRYCIQVDSTTMNQEELDYFVNQIEQQVEELFLETAQLKRKISTESSLFNREKENAQSESSSKDEDEKSNIENFENENKNDATFINNNVSKPSEKEFSIGGVINSANYSFIFKLKDSFEQIRDGIRKIKEH